MRVTELDDLVLGDRYRCRLERWRRGKHGCRSTGARGGEEHDHHGAHGLVLPERAPPNSNSGDRNHDARNTRSIGVRTIPDARVEPVTSTAGVPMRKLALLVVLIGSNAAAQPGADAPYPEPPPPAPVQPAQPPPPQPYGQPPPGYVPGGYVPGGMVPLQLTPDQVELLQKGEISDGQHVGGAFVSVFLGFGIGQAVQGRYGETGWIFTVGEIASFTALTVGLVQAIGDCSSLDEFCEGSRGDGLIIGGLVGLLVFRVWEVVDAFGGPPKHNRKVRELKMRLGMPMPMYTQRVTPYVNRTRDSGATAGLVFRF